MAVLAPDVLGSVEPRIFTPPLRELTPETSFGFDLIDFSSNVVGIELDPWEKRAAIRFGELLEDGRPRFRIVLILVARQNGKTTLAKVLVLYWMFWLGVPLVLTTGTDRSYAKKTWLSINEMIERNPIFADELANIRKTIGEEATYTKSGSELTFAANNASAGRSRTVNRALIDEVREHKSLDAWGAIKGAMNAVRDGQIVCISNQGDDTAALLDTLRDPAVEYIETGEGDPRLGLFEWSSPPGSEPDDLEALAAANPNLGHRVDVDSLLADARRAKRAGGLELALFRTEAMCQRVALLDPAIDPDAWELCGTSTPIDLAEYRNRVALCLDISLDGTHGTLTAAAQIDGVTHLEVVRAWDDMSELRRELPGVVEKVRPRRFGWFPNGPAAALAADLAERKGWPPRRVDLTPITSETASVAMAMPQLVAGRKVQHNRDELQDAHVARAQRLRRGDQWVFGRKGTGPIDGAYAAAGAVHLARTMPPPRPELVAL